MKVVGIGHKARQGKDSLAREIVILAGRRGLYAKQMAFADALRALARALGMEKKDPYVLQALGTDVCRRIDINFWVNILIDNLQEQYEGTDLIVITDVRFENEAKALHEAFGAMLVKLERLNADGSSYIAKDRDPNHPSEIALNDYKFHRHYKGAELADLKYFADRILYDLRLT